MSEKFWDKYLNRKALQFPRKGEQFWHYVFRCSLTALLGSGILVPLGIFVYELVRYRNTFDAFQGVKNESIWLIIFVTLSLTVWALLPKGFKSKVIEANSGARFVWMLAILFLLFFVWSLHRLGLF